MGVSGVSTISGSRVQSLYLLPFLETRHVQVLRDHPEIQDILVNLVRGDKPASQETWVPLGSQDLKAPPAYLASRGSEEQAAPQD